MRFLKRAVLVACCLPADLVVTLGAFLVIWPLWGTNLTLRRQHGSWAVTAHLKLDSWPARTWYEGWGGTTFGHFLMLSPFMKDDRLERLLMHEFVHVEQFEIGCVFGAVVMLASPLLFPIIGYWFPLVMWAASSVLYAACGYATAWLRGEPAYRGSAHEEAAYDAVTAYETKRHG